MNKKWHILITSIGVVINYCWFSTVYDCHHDRALWLVMITTILYTIKYLCTLFTNEQNVSATQDGPSPYSSIISSPPITTLPPLSTLSTSSLSHLLLHVILKFWKLFRSSTIGCESLSTPLRPIHGASSMHLRLTPGTFNNNAYSIIINDLDRSPYNTLKQSEFSTLRNMFTHRSERTNS